MKLIQSKLRALAIATGALLTVTTGANAQNTFYAPGDLVLYFQEEGGTDTVYVSLGNTATTFRGAAAGVDVANILNIININTELNTAFGASWASKTNLYAGLAGVWGTSGNLSTALQNGDPNRTLYVSQSRTSVGTVGTASSAGWSLASDGGMTSAASNMTAQNNVLETTYLTQAAVSPAGTSLIDDWNPFLAAGIQGNAFGNFAGGVQQVGGAGSFGDFGPVNNAEFALDLYRILAKTGIGGQVGGDLRVGSYEGTVVLDNSGNVSFVTSPVPEPSTYALLGIGAAALHFLNRRRNKQTA